MPYTDVNGLHLFYEQLGEGPPAPPAAPRRPAHHRAQLIGDTDFILVADAAHAAELLPGGQLAVLPGTTHMHLTRSELVAPLVDTFLRRDVHRGALAVP